MSAFEDAKRYLYLEGVVTADDPLDLLRRLVVEIQSQKTPITSWAATERTKLEQRVSELEAEVKRANDRTRTVEHANVQLEEQLKGDRLFRRVQVLEAEVKKANERTRLVEHQLVQKSPHKSR